MPHGQDESMPARLMTGLLAGVLRYPLLTIVVSLVLTAAAGFYSWKHLGYKTSRHDLVNSNNEYGRLWNDYIQEFGEEDDAVVVVEGESRTSCPFCKSWRPRWPARTNTSMRSCTA